MHDPSLTTRGAAARTRWLHELETALDHCDELVRALCACPENGEQAILLRDRIETAKKEIDRIRRQRPGARLGSGREEPSRALATWRGNRID